MQKHEQFYAMITAMFGPEDNIFTYETETPPKLSVFVWNNMPEKGMTTFVTYGISEIYMPEWKYGRPELILTLNTEKHDWSQAVGFIASRYRGKSTFSYGEVFDLEGAATDESDMSAFFIFAPSFLDKGQAIIDTAGSPIHLKGLYPIYSEEVEVYNRIGIEEFWHSDNFDMYDIHRKKVEIP